MATPNYETKLSRALGCFAHPTREGLPDRAHRDRRVGRDASAQQSQRDYNRKPLGCQ
jgi:hypothetical protein